MPQDKIQWVAKKVYFSHRSKIDIWAEVWHNIWEPNR